ncbi:MAG: hypothetical protein Q9178_001741 [Gyalolechia marmorata]
MFSKVTVIALTVTASLFQVARSSGLGTETYEDQESNIAQRQLRPDSPGTWLGWGAGIYNNRRASSDAKITSINVDSLHPTCKRVYGSGESAPPLVVDKIAYYPTWNGLFVALDYISCRVVWQTNVTRLINRYNSKYYTLLPPVSRTTPALYENSLVIGTLANALLLAFDRQTGRLIDRIQISDHPLAIVTQSPTAWQERIFVGSSSAEETGADTIPGYECCSFIATMNALSLTRQRFTLLWSQPMIPDGSNFTGAAIWGSQPAIDPNRRQVFIATGNVYSVPESYEVCSNKTVNTTSTDPGNATDPCAPKEVYQEAILAFNFVTGDINWSHQLSPIDAWNVACLPDFPGGGLNPGACPSNPGPDADFGMAPTFVPGSASTPSNEDTLVIGQKNGNLYALSASDGKLFWAVATSPTGITGGLIWGLAVDDTAVYYTAVNTERKLWKLKSGISISNSAFGAASLSDGTILWETPSPQNSTTQVPPTVANDVVLVGVGGPYLAPYTGPGKFLSLNKKNGTIIKETTLDAYFQAGIAVVHDYVMFGTGYSSTFAGNATGSFNVWRLSK